MITREATYQDLNELVRFARERHAVSGWAKLPFSPTKMRNNVITMIRTEGMGVLIAEDKGEIHGLLLAGMDQFFFNSMVYATDVHFVADKGGPALLREFFRWAEQRGCAACVMSVANDDPEGRTAQFYTSMGMERKGHAFVKWLGVHAAQEQAA